MNSSNMFFVEANTINEINAFIDWVSKKNVFPFQFYLNGITYTIQDELWQQMFVVGYTAGVECGRKAKAV